MKFIPAINIHEPGIEAQLYSGEMKLQPGQWIHCGDGTRASRFAGATRHVIYASHPGADKAPTLDHFQRMRKCAAEHISEQEERNKKAKEEEANKGYCFEPTAC
jgi:hypothetical protein